jgi:hypothetical protein
MARAASARNLSASSSARWRGALPPSGMEDCAELLDISHVQLSDVLAAGSAHDTATWLSAALTNQGNCGDSLAAVPATTGREGVRRRVSALAEFIGAALALHAKFKGGSETIPAPPPSAASTPTSSPPNRTFPSGVRPRQKAPGVRRGGRDARRRGGPGRQRDAQDHRRGDHRPDGGNNAAGGASVGAGRKVIYVKAGRYEESVRISSKQRDVMLMGDGKGKTVIVGHRSAADGYTTYDSATVGT